MAKKRSKKTIIIWAVAVTVAIFAFVSYSQQSVAQEEYRRMVISRGFADSTKVETTYVKRPCDGEFRPPSCHTRTTGSSEIKVHRATTVVANCTVYLDQALGQPQFFLWEVQLANDTYTVAVGEAKFTQPNPREEAVAAYLRAHPGIFTCLQPSAPQS